MKACFIGHKYIEKTEALTLLIKNTIIELINKGVNTFMFGSMSEFNNLCLDIVTELKKNFPSIKRIYVRSSYPYIDKQYREYLLKFYEETYFPQKIENAGRYSYVERNYEMIDSCDYCVFYFNKNYQPIVNQNRKNKMLLPKERNSGTKIAYLYAVKHGKKIINLYQ